MNFDDQMVRYFGTKDLASVAPGALDAGRDRLAVDFGLETDPGRRFAMWALLYILGSAPDLEQAFENREDRETARSFMDILAQSGAE